MARGRKKGDEIIKPEKTKQIVNINDAFRFIVHGAGDYELQQLMEYKDKDGNVSHDFKWIGWFGYLSHLAMRFTKANARYKISTEDVTDMKNVVRVHKESQKETVKFFKNMKKKDLKDLLDGE
jgi:hypothetical protein